MSKALASRLGFALRHAKKDGVEKTVLDYVSAALKALSESDGGCLNQTASSLHPDPWWCGEDPWQQNCTPVNTLSTQHVFNPKAASFAPSDWLHLPCFAPAVREQVEQSMSVDTVTELRQQMQALSASVSAISEKVECAFSSTGGASQQQVEGSLSKYDAEMRIMQDKILEEFQEYDAKLSEFDELVALLSEKIDGAEGLFREIHITESRILAYSDRWWKAERNNEEGFKNVLENMKKAGAPEWALVDARWKNKQHSQTDEKYNAVAHEINKIWRRIGVEEVSENQNWTSPDMADSAAEEG